MVGRLKAIRPCRIAYISVNASGPQIGACTQNDRLCVVYSAGKGLYASYSALFYNQLRYLCLAYGQVFGLFQGLPHGLSIGLLIRLGPEGVNRRPLGFI